ncbi:hypothetical protein QQZ08_003767 [Neonectria magnoliae]|uniref:Uncharacterized protein n=1 Tax=Neonectria magnoliae TaxID=2732573 RepID=A0ABR1I8V0_9HYPO
MSSPEPTAKSLTKLDILAFDAKQLVQLQDIYSLPDGPLQLPFDWWNAMSNDEQTRFTRRIKYIICREETHDLAIKRETNCYDDLVLDGGRPLFPIEQLEAVSRDPKPRLKMLKSWILPLDTKEKWKVFTRQFRWWQNFRKWQTDNRGLEDNDTYPIWLERRRRHFGVNDSSEQDERWLRLQKEREERGVWCREKECDGFADYAKAVHRRLAQHNFTRPFKLDEDIKKQDRLTTWIEYLNYEYWWFDRYVESFKRSKCDREEVWQELVDGKLLTDRETRGHLRTRVRTAGLYDKPDVVKDIVADNIRAVEVARRAVREQTVIGTPEPEAVREETVSEAPESEAIMKAAAVIKRAISKIEPVSKYNRPMSTRIEKLQAATAQLERAEAKLDWQNTRFGLFNKFADARGAMRKARKAANRQKIVVGWVREQVHVIEAEMLHTEANQAESAITKSPIANSAELSGDEVDSDERSWSWASDTPVSDDERHPSAKRQEADHTDSSQADSRTVKRPVGEDDEELPGEPSAKCRKMDHIESSTSSSTRPVAVTENREVGPEPRVVENPESPVVEGLEPEPHDTEDLEAGAEPHAVNDPESSVVEDHESPVTDAPESRVIGNSESSVVEDLESPVVEDRELEPRVIGNPESPVVEDLESPLTDPPESPVVEDLGGDLDDTQDKDQGSQGTQSAVANASLSVDATGEGPISSRLRKRDSVKVHSSSRSVDAPRPSNPKPKPKPKSKTAPKGKAKGKK